MQKNCQPCHADDSQTENRGKNDQNKERILVETFLEIFWLSLAKEKRKFNLSLSRII